MSAKSPTDHHWDQRAITELDDAKVNMPETVQRDLELQFIFELLWSGARLLEVGCGNGYVTQQLRTRVAHVDAFDRSEKMLERAGKGRDGALTEEDLKKLPPPGGRADG